MIPAIIIGRGGSKGFPGKNFYKINNHPIMAYPIIAASRSCNVDGVYFSTEDSRLKNIAKSYGADIIDRPLELATDAALGEDVFIHAYNQIYVDDIIYDYNNKTDVEFALLMFANAPGITSWMIDEMIELIRENAKIDDSIDSICTVSKYNMFSPSRMRRFDGLSGTKLLPYTNDYANATCDRDSTEDAYIYDCSCAIVRPRCLENIEEGLPPQRWLGRRNILGYKQTDPILDIDYEWQVGHVKWWLDRNWM